MDVTPQELRGSEIKEAFRGYHRDEVDDLLERAAVTIENLTRQVQESSTRVADAPLTQVSRDDAETIQRTLLLAQRAADDAVAEAQARARQIVDESEAKAQTLVGEAEATARRIHEGERRRLETEITELVARRDGLTTDVDALESFAASYRDRVRAAIEADLASLSTAIDAPPARPTLSEVPEPAGAPTFDTEYAVDDTTSASSGFAADGGFPREAPAGGSPITAPAAPEAEWPPPPGAPVAPATPMSMAADPGATQAFTPYDLRDDAPPPAPFSSDVAMEAQAIDTDALDDDAFFASLRDAVRDDTPLGPIGDDPSPFFDDAEAQESQRRFRRR